MIPIHLEPDDGPPLERCCFCRERTKFWTSLPGRKPGEQVACCKHCASRGEPHECLTKDDWCRRESIAHRPTIGEIMRGEDRRYPDPPLVDPPV